MGWSAKKWDQQGDRYKQKRDPRMEEKRDKIASRVGVPILPSEGFGSHGKREKEKKQKCRDGDMGKIDGERKTLSKDEQSGISLSCRIKKGNRQADRDGQSDKSEEPDGEKGENLPPEEQGQRVEPVRGGQDGDQSEQIGWIK